MSFDSLLKDTCVVIGKTVTGTENTGHPKFEWTDELETLPCRVERIEYIPAIHYQNIHVEGIYNAHRLYCREPKTMKLDDIDHRIEWDGMQFKILRISQSDDYFSKHHLEVDMVAAETRG